MKNPDPINLMTRDEARAGGWAFDCRDADGHLVWLSGEVVECDAAEAQENGWTITALNPPAKEATA